MGSFLNVGCDPCVPANSAGLFVNGASDPCALAKFARLFVNGACDPCALVTTSSVGAGRSGDSVLETIGDSPHDSSCGVSITFFSRSSICFLKAALEFSNIFMRPCRSLICWDACWNLSQVLSSLLRNFLTSSFSMFLAVWSASNKSVTDWRKTANSFLICTLKVA